MLSSSLLPSRLLFFATVLIVNALGQRCTVVEEGSGEERPCRFPFVYRGVARCGCIRTGHPEGRRWCSTRIDEEDDGHVSGGGFYGVCRDGRRDCPVGNDDEEEALAGDDELREEFYATLHNVEAISGNTSSCPCLSLNSCPPLLHLGHASSGLPRCSRERRAAVVTLRTLLCSRARKTFRCCENNEPVDGDDDDNAEEDDDDDTGEKDDDGDDDQATAANEKDGNYDDPSLGTWRPRLGSCGVPLHHSGTVIGGEAAAPGEFPFAALLGYRLPDDPLGDGRVAYACGGAILNAHYVLTAAHCVDGQHGGKLVEVLLGEHDLGVDETRDCVRKRVASCPSTPQKRVAEDIVVHELWNRQNYSLGNDVALVRLDRPVITFVDDPSVSVTPVCLAWGDGGEEVSPPGPGETATVVGWGKITNSDVATLKSYELYGGASRVPNKLELPLLPGSECEAAYPHYSALNQVCAGGEKGKDSCTGDSGGTLLYRDGFTDLEPWYQMGIVSYGSLVCGIGQPAAFTRVSAYIDWIKDHMKP